MNHEVLIGSDPADAIGRILLESGKMTSDQVAATSIFSAERNLLFGQAAVLLGFVSSADVSAAMVGHPADIEDARGGEISADVIVLKDPLSPRAADIRRLAQALAMRWFRGETPHPALSVISADRGEGRTMLSANLASVFARAGVRTLLIDADLHNPGIHRKFGLEPAATDASSAYYHVPGVANLSIMPASALFEVEYEKFMQSAFAAVIDAKAAEFDVMLVDTPAASVSNDYLLAGLATKGAVVVTRERVTRARAAARMLNACDDAGIPVIGGIMLKD